MPTRQLPNTHASILRSLIAAREGWKQFPGDRIITAAHWAKLDDSVPTSFLSRYLKEHNDIDLAKALQAPATDDHAAAINKLRMFVSHFHQVFDLGIARGTFTRAGRAYYGRDLDGDALPPLVSTDEVLLAASRIYSGESERIAQGGAGAIYMALPSAVEVEDVYQAALAAHTSAETAKLATDTEENETNEMFAEARALAVSIINTIEFNLTERTALDAPGRRRIARAWGVIYLNDDGTIETDPPEPEPEP